MNEEQLESNQVEEEEYLEIHPESDSLDEIWKNLNQFIKLIYNMNLCPLKSE